MSSSILLRIIIKTLERHGFIFVSQKGSHQKYKSPEATVIIPVHGKEVPYGTFNCIVRQSGLKKEDFR